MYHQFFIDAHHINAANILCRNLHYILPFANPDHKPLAFMCIGSTKIAGDNLGPVIGSILHSVYPYVYGTLDAPVNALNLNSFLPAIPVIEKEFCIIVVDASFDSTCYSDQIILCDTGLSPGSGLHQDRPLFPEIGHIQITGTFNELGTEKAQAILPLYCRNIGLSLLKLL